MPVYLYRCLSHERHAKEYILPYDHEPPTCEKCGEPKDKVICPVPAHFVGDGWSNHYNDVKVHKPAGAK